MGALIRCDAACGREATPEEAERFGQWWRLERPGFVRLAAHATPAVFWLCSDACLAQFARDYLAQRRAPVVQRGG